MMCSIFIFGGVCLGKFVFVEWLVCESGLLFYYIVMGQVWDVEMCDCIGQYQSWCGVDWIMIEVLFELFCVIILLDFEENVIFIDCLMLWVINLMMVECDMDEVFEWFVFVIVGVKVCIFIVFNEVGFGIVLDNVMVCVFCDYVGWLYQKIVVVVDEVYFVVVGLLFKMKG